MPKTPKKQVLTVSPNKPPNPKSLINSKMETASITIKIISPAKLFCAVFFLRFFLPAARLALEAAAIATPPVSYK